MPEGFGDNWGTIGPLRPSEESTAASQLAVFVDAEEGNRTPKGVSPGDFESRQAFHDGLRQATK